jgi:hypothetical protein
MGKLTSGPGQCGVCGLQWAGCFGPDPNEQLLIRFKPICQTALNLNQPIGGLPELEQIQIKYGCEVFEIRNTFLYKLP